MEYSNQIVVSDGTLQLVALTLPYIDKADVHVSVDFGDGMEEYAPGTIWDWVGSEAIRFHDPLPDGTVGQIQRQTEIGGILNKFTLGAMFNAPTLDENFDQLMYIAQEYSDVRGAAGRSLRVPPTETAVAALPERAERANKLLSFDAGGQPKAVLPVADSAMGVRTDLADPAKGAEMVAYQGGTVADKLDEIVSGAVTGPMVDAKVSTHNHDDDAHPELRTRIVSEVSSHVTAEANRAEAASNAAFINADVKTSIEAGLTGPESVEVGEQFQVLSADGMEYRRYRKDSETVAVEVGDGFPSSSSVRVLQANMLETVPGKNLINKGKIVRRERYSNAASSIVVSNGWRRSDFIPVKEGVAYATSGNLPGLGIAFLADAATDIAAILFTTARTVTAPEGARFAVVNITNTGHDDTTYDGTVQLEEGSEATEYQPYERAITPEKVKGLDRIVGDLEGQIGEALRFDDVLEIASFNLIDPAAADYTRRLTGTGAFTNDSLGIAASDFIPVKEGDFYTLSGSAVYASGSGGASPMGAFYGPDMAQPAVALASFFQPVSGDGWVLQVPTGVDAKYLVVNLWKEGRVPEGTQLDGLAQLERGEMATPYQPYDPVERIRPELLSGETPQPGPSPEPGGSFDAEAWYRFTDADDGHYLSGKFPVFRRHWFMKDKDLCVVNTGTSLTARSIEHCTAHPDAPFRPPLMHSNNMASILWDCLKWEGQEYRRYDSGYFSEIGTFSTESNLPEWDDGPFRSGLTRYAEAGGGVSFSIPAGAWQFNFIYRTDTVASEVITVVVTDGVGLVEVYDENANAWVEANGFEFSMRETEPVPRSVEVPRASDGVMVSRDIPSKGNTTYQKRLRMRCKSGTIDSREAAKSVTVEAQGSGRFSYWGVEWSVREFMITYINAARGSHNTQADATRGLPKWQDNEIWSFKPDLLFFELPIHNDGAASAVPYNSGQWARLTDHFVFRDDYELSLITRGRYFGLEPEIGMFTSSISWNFDGINEDGTLKIGPDLNTGKMLTALDKYNEACMWVWDNHPEAVCINAAKRWVDAGMAIFGNLRTATEGSGKDGLSFTNEGSHWNDTGSKIIAKALVPLFDFTHP